MQSTGANSSNASKFVNIIDDILDKYEINTPARVSAFLAQVGHESGNLRYVKEIWGPTKAQERYEGRLDLGNTEKGDGKKYMGRGLLQVTGRSNYALVGAELGLPLLENPALLEQPNYALESACVFWRRNRLNEVADSGDFKLLTRKINGGYNGLTERTALYEKAAAVFA